MPLVSCIIYSASVQPLLSHGKKKSTGGRAMASPSGRISARSLLETLLAPGACGSRCPHGLRSSFPVAAQLPAAALRLAHPALPQLNKGEVNSATRGPVPIETHRSDFGHGRRLLLSGWLLREKARWVFAMFKEPNAGKPLPPPRPKGPQPLRLRAACPAALPDASLPPRTLYRRPQINSQRFEIIISLWSASMKIYKTNL